MTTYRVKDWAKNFESAESKRTKRLSWVAMPNKHDGKSYRRLVRHPQAVAIFCAWNLIVQIASKTDERGILESGGHAITALDLADATGFPEEIFALAFEALTDPRIGWLEITSGVAIPGQNASRPGQTAQYAGRNGKHAGQTALHPPTDRQDSTDRTDRTNKGPQELSSDEVSGADQPAEGTANLADDPEQAWRMERLEAWAKLLAPILGNKLGPKTWPAWKRLVARFQAVQVVKILEGMSPDRRWVDVTEIELLAAENIARPSGPCQAAVRAKALVTKHGLAQVRKLTGIELETDLVAVEALTENPSLADLIEESVS